MVVKNWRRPSSRLATHIALGVERERQRAAGIGSGNTSWSVTGTVLSMVVTRNTTSSYVATGSGKALRGWAPTRLKKYISFSAYPPPQREGR